MTHTDDSCNLDRPFKLGKIVIDPVNLTLQSDTQRHNCEPKVFEVLLFFCQHQQQLISRDQLLASLWQGKVVSDNTINRKIYQLRKLLSELDDEGEYIETVPKHGYRLTQPCSSIEQPMLSSVLDNKQKLLLQWWLAPLLVVLSLLIFGQLQSTTDNQATLTLTQITSELGVETDPALSPDMQSLVYSYSPDGDRYQLLIKDIQTTLTIPITPLSKSIQDRFSQWHPDGSKIAFVRLDGKNHPVCTIYLWHKRTNQISKVSECEAANKPTLSWGAQPNQLFIAQRAKKTLPYNIFAIDTVSGQIQQKTTIPATSNLKGNYFIKRDHKGRKQLVLHYLGSNKVQVKIFDSQHFNLDYQFELNAHIDDIAWQPNTSAFYFRRGQYIDKVEQNGKERQMVFHLGSKFDGLDFSRDGRQLLLSRKEHNTDIYQYQLDKRSPEKAIINSTKLDIRPRYSPIDNQIAYISDRNGKKVFWLRDAQGNEQPLKGQTFDVGTPNFTWSPDAKSILFEYQDQIYTVDPQTGTHKVVIDSSHQAYTASWSHHGKEIIYGSVKSGDWQLWSYDLQNQQHHQLTHNGGYSGYQDSQGQLYFSKYHQDGLYKLEQDKQETLIIADFSLLNWLNWRIKDDQVYFAKLFGEIERSQAGIYRYDLTTRQQQRILPYTNGLLHDHSISKDGKAISYTRHISQTGDIMALAL